MRGLGLTNAVNEYRRGVEFDQNRQAQEQQRQFREQQMAEQRRMLQEQEAQRQRDKMANDAVSKVMDTSKAEWAMNGAHGTWTPNDSTNLAAAEARGKVYAQQGDWNSYLRNEAAVQPIRMQLRQKALQRYNVDGDAEALMRSVYPTVFDGQGIEAVQKAQTEDGKPVLRVTFSGQDKPTDIAPADLVGMVKSSLVDPMASAKAEMQHNLRMALLEARQNGTMDAIAARGGQARETEGVKQENRLGLEAVKGDRTDARAKADRDSRERVAANRDATTLAAARVRAAGSGGASADGKAKIQSTKVDANGYLVGVRADGSTERLVDTNTGKPIRSDEWAKRVDSVAKQLADAPGNGRKKPEELRKQAEQMLTSEAPPATAPAPAATAAPARAPAGLSAASPGMQVDPRVQAQRDAAAGAQIIRNELGGDPQRVAEEVKQLRLGLQQAKQAGQPEAATVLEQRLRAIEAATAGGNVSRPQTRPGLSSFGGAPASAAQGGGRPPLSAFQK